MAWISGNYYLNEEQMQNNVDELWTFAQAQGWTANATAAMAGNMEIESTINPGIWQSLTVDETKGFGLVQWTPATRYIDWVYDTYGTGVRYADANKELARLIYESTHTSEAWFNQPNCPVPIHPITMAEFFVSELPVGTLAQYWLWYYERPKILNDTPRVQAAEKWYTYITGETPAPPLPTPTKRKKMPLQLYLFPFKKYFFYKN